MFGIGKLFRKASKTTESGGFANNRPVWNMGRKFKSYADEGFEKNVVVYRGIDKTAKAVASIPIYAKSVRGKRDDKSDLAKLIQKPNLMQTGSDLMEQIAGFYMLAGNSYLEKTMLSDSRVGELYCLRPDRMSIKPGSTGIPKTYQFAVANEEPVFFPVDEIRGYSDILHMKQFNPTNDWYGLSPLSAGAFAVDQHNETMQAMQSMLANGMVPSGALKTNEELSDPAYKRLKEQMQEKSGSRNSGKTLLLENGVTWEQMGVSPDNMMMIETKYSSARDIALALGVPPLLLNIPGDATYSNYKEARLAHYEETVIPLAEYIIDSMNRWLAPYFGGQTLALDLDRIPAIYEKRLTLWDMANKSNDLTINERRKIKGYPPVEGGDTVFVGSGQVPISFADDGLPGEGEVTEE
jgi:HK97 family phage portal protein